MQALAVLPAHTAAVLQGRGSPAAEEMAGFPPIASKSSSVAVVLTPGSFCTIFASASRVVSIGNAEGRRGAFQLSSVGNRGWELNNCRNFLHRQLYGPIRTKSALLSAGRAEASLKWILEAVGDGNCKHLDKEVVLPSTFELFSDSITVGRSEDKVDVVLSVATVSGVHARLEKKANALYVTDLGSTNGTFVNEKRIKSGTATPVPPGSLLTFGDEHLALFRFTQVAIEEETKVVVKEKEEKEDKEEQEEKEEAQAV